jgi:hypothetical protein
MKGDTKIKTVKLSSLKPGSIFCYAARKYLQNNGKEQQ